MFEVGEECQRRALRYFVETEGMSYGQIVKFIKGCSPETDITIDRLKGLARRMKAAGDPLKTKQPKELQNAKRKKSTVVSATVPVENSEPEIKPVQVVVVEPAPEPKPTPEPTPSVPSAGNPVSKDDEPITPTGKLNKSMKIIVKRERISGKVRMKAIAELSQLKEELEKTWTIAQRERTKLGASIHAMNVEIAEKQLVKDGETSICKSLTKIAEEAEAVRKAARQALYHLHFVDMP